MTARCRATVRCGGLQFLFAVTRLLVDECFSLAHALPYLMHDARRGLVERDATLRRYGHQFRQVGSMLWLQAVGIWLRSLNFVGYAAPLPLKNPCPGWGRGEGLKKLERVSLGASGTIPIFHLKLRQHATCFCVGLEWVLHKSQLICDFSRTEPQVSAAFQRVFYTV